MALTQPGVSGTGKKSTVKGIFATTDHDMSANQNHIGGLPGRPVIFNKWNPNDNSAATTQSEALARQAARRARGVIEDDEPQGT